MSTSYESETMIHHPDLYSQLLDTFGRANKLSPELGRLLQLVESQYLQYENEIQKLRDNQSELVPKKNGSSVKAGKGLTSLSILSGSEVLRKMLTHAPYFVFATDEKGIIISTEGAGLLKADIDVMRVLGKPITEVFIDLEEPQVSWEELVGNDYSSWQALLGNGLFEFHTVSYYFAEKAFAGVSGIAHLQTDRPNDIFKKNMVSVVSHELRTPLTSMLGSLKLLRKGVGGGMGAEGNSLLEIAQANGERLMRLLNDIIDIERIESGAIDFSCSIVKLKHIVEEAVMLNGAYAMQEGVTFEIDEASVDSNICVDKSRLLQVITNILSNAAKFSPSGTPVRIALDQRDHFARIAISDSGPGISEDFKAKIFEKFSYRDPEHSDSRTGAGLGLSISKAITEQLGGTIGFESKEGSGTTFFIEIPIVAEEVS
ncbi:MAG: hypothetical protein CL946_07310 [Ectothiorhodospiraceae bacterium]|nr:hypothetical protein [Ectothiorhodospiraceae bacterium]